MKNRRRLRTVSGRKGSQGKVEVGVGALKMQDMKMQDMKLTDRYARHEIAGHEIAAHENAGHENAGHELTDMQRQSRKLAQKRQTSESK